jgi:hypothetical protein
MILWSLLLEKSGLMYVRLCSPTRGVVWRRETLIRSQKVLLHGEPPKGKVLNLECVYMFTIIEHLGAHKIKAVTDFLDSRALNEGN